MTGGWDGSRSKVGSLHPWPLIQCGHSPYSGDGIMARLFRKADRSQLQLTFSAIKSYFLAPLGSIPINFWGTCFGKGCHSWLYSCDFNSCSPFPHQFSHPHPLPHSGNGVLCETSGDPSQVFTQLPLCHYSSLYCLPSWTYHTTLSLCLALVVAVNSLRVEYKSGSSTVLCNKCRTNQTININTWSQGIL